MGKTRKKLESLSFRDKMYVFLVQSGLPEAGKRQACPAFTGPPHSKVAAQQAVMHKHTDSENDYETFN